MVGVTESGGAMLAEALARVAFEYPSIRHQPMTGHPLAEFIRMDAAKAVRDALGDLGRDLLVKGSPGQGNFAEVPWVAVFDPVVTHTATAGYYVVYLFSADGARVSLSLNQGTTAVHKEHGGRYVDVLRERAQFIRGRLTGHVEGGGPPGGADRPRRHGNPAEGVRGRACPRPHVRSGELAVRRRARSPSR
jgi:hypothetical protein